MKATSIMYNCTCLLQHCLPPLFTHTPQHLSSASTLYSLALVACSFHSNRTGVPVPSMYEFIPRVMNKVWLRDCTLQISVHMLVIRLIPMWDQECCGWLFRSTAPLVSPYVPGLAAKHLPWLPDGHSHKQLYPLVGVLEPQQSHVESNLLHPLVL